jgi:hypothetical protein
MQILIYTDKTYTLDIYPDITIDDLKILIEEKTKISVENQVIIFGGKIISHLSDINSAGIKMGDCLRVWSRIRGGNFFSTGELVFYLIISLAMFFISFPLNLLGLKFFLMERANFKSQDTTSLQSNSLSGFWTFLVNNFSNAGLNKGRYSLLLFIYLLVSFGMTVIYSGTMTQLINTYFRCQNDKPSGNALIWLGILGVVYVMLFPLVLVLSRYNWVASYSIVIFSVLAMILIGIYLGYIQNKYNNLMYGSLVLMISILMQFNIENRWWSLFIIPLMMSLYFIYIYTIDYQKTFSELC